MLENNKLNLRDALNTFGSATENPFDRTGTGDILFGPGNEWVGYTFGSLFVVLGLICFLFIRRAQRNVREYKERQMDAYASQNHGRRPRSYEASGMFVPAWERAKSFAPILFGMVFIMIGIAWIVGNTLGTL